MNSGDPKHSKQGMRGWTAVLLLIAAVALPIRMYLIRSRRPPPPPDTKRTAAADPLANVSSAAETAANWETEEFASSADKQLKKIAKSIESPSAITPANFSGILTKDFDCTKLRPAIDKQFSDGALAVFRSSHERGPRIADDAGSVSKAHQGADGLATFLMEMTTPLKGMDDIHVKFKVISVSAEVNGNVTTNVVYQASGRDASNSFQQSAVWTCRWKTTVSDLPLLASLRATQYEESTAAAPTGTLFADCTESVLRNEPDFAKQFGPGIDTWRTATQSQYGVYPYGHHGIAVCDVNQDGLDDVYVCQPIGLPNRLYIQNLDGTVTDMAPSMGVNWMDRSRGALFVDLDNDGDQDLVVAVNEMLVILSFDEGKFTERTVFRPNGDPGSLVAADYDLDGDLDLYIVSYGKRFLSDGESSGPLPYHDANNGGANVLLRNEEDWTFTDVTIESGLDTNNRRWSFAASWEDYDDDGDVDLYVANDFGRNNLYRNEGGRFEDVAAAAGVEDIAAGMSVSWADYDQDGKMDLYVGNMFSSAGLRIAFQDRFQPDADAKVREEFQRHARGNSLFRNLGNGKFEDVSEATGVTLGRWAWGSKFVDINNDSREDIVVTNGFVTGSDLDDL